MSRCFPYAPLAPPRHGARGEAASAPFKIKLRKEKGKYAITGLGIEKRGENEDRTEEKVKKEENCYVQVRKRNEDAESSGITEEHGQPVCYLSDGSQSSKKRKLDHLVAFNGYGGKSSGNTIRIRLPLRKHKDPDVSINGIASAGFVPRQNGIACMPEKASCSLDSSETKETSACNVETVQSLYKALIEDWIWDSSSCQFGQKNTDDSQDWLFGPRNAQKHGMKNGNACQDGSWSVSSDLWPRADYLPEADVYALPYTVPF